MVRVSNVYFPNNVSALNRGLNPQPRAQQDKELPTELPRPVCLYFGQENTEPSQSVPLINQFGYWTTSGHFSGARGVTSSASAISECWSREYAWWGQSIATRTRKRIGSCLCSHELPIIEELSSWYPSWRPCFFFRSPTPPSRGGTPHFTTFSLQMKVAKSKRKRSTDLVQPQKVGCFSLSLGVPPSPPSSC